MQDSTLTFPMGIRATVTINEKVLSENEVELFRRAIHRTVIETSARIVQRSKESDDAAFRQMFFERRQCQDFIELLDGVGDGSNMVPASYDFPPASPHNVHINNRPISDALQKMVIKSLECYHDNWATKEEKKDVQSLYRRVKEVTQLTAEQNKEVDNQLSSSKVCGTEVHGFIVARAKYMWLLRLQGKTDVEIAKKVTVEYRDSGDHVRQIFRSIGID